MLQYYLSQQYHVTETDDFLIARAADGSVTLPVRRKFMALSLSVFHTVRASRGHSVNSCERQLEVGRQDITFRPLRVSCNCVPMYSRPRFVGITDELLAHFP